MQNFKMENETTKSNILKAFADCAMSMKRMPSFVDLEENVVVDVVKNGVSTKKSLNKGLIEHHFLSLARLKEKAMEKYPENFSSVIEESVYMPKAMKELKDVLGDKKVKTIVVASANANAPLHSKAVSGIKTFAREQNAAIIVGATEGEHDLLPSELYEDEQIHVLFEDIHLNNAICLSVAPISKKNTDPLSSKLKKMVRLNNASMVFFSPYQGMDSIPCERGRHPDVIYSTGSVSRPWYNTDGRKTLSDENATYMHNLGAVIIELDGQNRFFIRNVMIDDKTGDFIDLGVRYCASGKVKVETPALLAYGDIHSYVKDEVAFNCALGIATTLKIAEGVVHDIMDCHTESHHKKHRKAEQASMVMANEANYGHEIRVLTDDFNKLTSAHSKGVRVVPSNHDDMDSRSLEAGDFQTGTLNSVYGCILFPYQVAWNLVAQGKKNVARIMANYLHVNEKELVRRFPGIEKGIAPLQAAVEFCGPDSPEKIHWHRRNDSYKVGRTEVLLHGDKGNNGGGYSVGSALLAVGTGSAITGHSHSPKQRGHLMVLGCLTKKEQPYNMGGFSSWMHTVALGYENGAKQMLIIVDGKYTNFKLELLMKKYK
jgi:hypothetical protein